MKLKLRRPLSCDKDATIGQLFIDGVFECFTLEDKDRYLESSGEKVAGSTCIPRGTYKVTITHSNRFNRLLPLVHDVPQFEGIRIHPGNSSSDTEGCILVGMSVVNNCTVKDSRVAFSKLFDKITLAIAVDEEVELEVV